MSVLHDCQHSDNDEQVTVRRIGSQGMKNDEPHETTEPRLHRAGGREKAPPTNMRR